MQFSGLGLLLGIFIFGGLYYLLKGKIMYYFGIFIVLFCLIYFLQNLTFNTSNTSFNFNIFGIFTKKNSDTSLLDVINPSKTNEETNKATFKDLFKKEKEKEKNPFCQSKEKIELIRYYSEKHFKQKTKNNTFSESICYNQCLYKLIEIKTAILINSIPQNGIIIPIENTIEINGIWEQIPDSLCPKMPIIEINANK